jgi:hypothetical protein
MIEYNISPSSPVPHPTVPDWKGRARLSLEQQWALAQDLLALGRRILASQAGLNHGRTSLAQVERILHLATRLARLSTDLAQQSAQSQEECPKCCAARLEWEAALRKVYGQETGAPALPSPSAVEHALPSA